MFKSRITAATAAVLVALALGADGDVQTVEVGGIKFEAPKAWEASKPARPGMRLMQIKIKPAKGDDQGAELVLTALGGGGGPLEANLDRWRKQFEGKDGGPAEVKSEDRKGKNVDVTFVEIAGRYVAPVTPGQPDKFDKAGWRLLGAIVPTETTGYYLKLVGPEKTVSAAKPAFEALIKSIEVEKP